MSQRELIVSGPAGDPMVREQLEALRADPGGAAERELEVRERQAPAFVVERWDNLVGVTELWARIDASPVRGRELRAVAPDQPTRTELV
jgi:hypothetical protein